MAGNIDNIIQTILNEASREAGEIRENGKRQAERLRSDVQAETERAKREIAAEAERACHEARVRAEASANLEIRKAVLSMRQGMIDQVFLRVQDALGRLDQRQYDELIFRLALENAEGGEQMILPEGRMCGAELLQRINDALEASGRPGLSLAGEARNFSGGFILAKTGVEINCSFEALIRVYRERLQSEVASMLFAEES